MNPQPTPAPSPEPAAPPAAVVRDARWPSRLRAGILLLAAGAAFTGVILAWGYFALRAVSAPQGFVDFFQTQDALEAGQALLLSLGFYLLFEGVLRILPRRGAWTHLGPVLILVGGACLVVGDILGIALAPYFYAPLSGQPIDMAGMAPLMSASSVVNWLGSIAGLAGTILSVVAVAQGALLRREPVPPGTAG